MSNTEHPKSVFARRMALMLSGAAGAALLAGGAVHAQEASGANGDQPGVVTITAEKRTENLQRVPLSATVRTGGQLKDEGVYGIQALQNQTPGLSIQPPTSAETYINIRGVGIQQTSPVSSNGVAFYVDGMYVPSLIDTVDTFYDLQNVEVLRGPQGTLVGSNADGGAIFVNSVQPSFDRVKGYVQQTIGNYADYRTEGGINLPINDMIAARLAFVYETRDSFTTNIGAYNNPTGSCSVTSIYCSPYSATYPPAQNQPGNVDFNAVRLQVRFKPTDNVDFTVRFEPYESRTDGFAQKPDEAAVAPLWNYYSGNAYPYNQIPATSSPFYDPWAAAHQGQAYTVDYDTPQYFNIQGQRTSGTVVWHLTPGIELKDIVSFQNGYESDLSSADANSALDGTYQTRKATFSDYTEEVNLLSTGSGPLQWVVGAYYLNSTNTGQFQFNTSGAYVPAGPGGPAVIRPVLANLNTITPGLAINGENQHITTAVFGSITYSFSPQWSVSLGGRYSQDYEPARVIVIPPTIIAHYTDAEPTGSVKLNFQATPSTLVYVSVSNGYKAGGLNFVPLVPYAPETNVVEELGLKTDFLNHHLRFDGDVYYSQYNHYQLQETLIVNLPPPPSPPAPPGTPGGTLATPWTQTPGAANIWGFEGELSGVFGDFQFNLGVSYLNATVAKTFPYQGPDTNAPNGGLFPIPAGTTIPYAPQWSVTAGAQYSFHVWNGLLTPRIQYQFQDTQYTSIAHIAAAYPLNLGVTIPAHGTWDFFLTYAAPEHWQIQGYVTNFTNATYISGALPSPSAGAPPLYAYGAPLQYGVRLSYNF